LWRQIRKSKYFLPPSLAFFAVHSGLEGTGVFLGGGESSFAGASADKSLFCCGVGGGLGCHMAALFLFHLDGGLHDRFAGLKLGLVVWALVGVGAGGSEDLGCV